MPQHSTETTAYPQQLLYRVRQSRWVYACWFAWWTVYTTILFIQPGTWCPIALRRLWLRPRIWMLEQIRDALSSLGINPVSQELQRGIFFAITAGLIPWAILLIARRGRPHDIGLRMPNRLGWRVLGIGTLVALPFLYWMAREPSFSTPYLSWIQKAGWGSAIAYYVGVLFVEHLFFHGVLLAEFRREGRWPAPVPVVEDARSPLRRALQWIGFAQPTSGAGKFKSMIRWIGLPDGCVVAILLAGLLFAGAHVGKHPRELLLSWPGGTILGYVAYRTNTWLIPLGLHIATAVVVTIIMLISI